MVHLRLLLTMVIALLLGACAGAAGSGEVISSGDRYLSTAATAAVEEYRLGVGDKVRLTVFNERELSGEFAVSANGMLSLPLIGEVEALNRQVPEIATDVQTQLANGYLRDPKVSMEVITYRPYFILGEVSAPGQYPYTIGLTALNAVATAEGFTPRSDRRVAYIRRPGSAKEEAYALTPDLRVLPGDTIRIGERFF